MRLLAWTFGLLLIGGALAGSAVYASRAQNMSFQDMATEWLVSAMARTPSSTAYDGLLNAGPKERQMTDIGWELPVGIVAAANGQHLNLASIGLPPELPEGTNPEPARVAEFAANETCAVQPVRASDVLHNIRLDDTSRYTHTHVFSKEELAKAVLKRLEAASKHAKNYARAAIAEGRMGQVDVFVTDTSAPVHLVLQSHNRDVIWDVHLAPGATLSHVAIIGNKSALAAPAGDYTVEAVRISDFTTPEDFYLKRDPETCPVLPVRAIKADWRLHQKRAQELHGDHYKKVFNDVTSAHAAYAGWFEGNLGRAVSENLVSAKQAAHVLAGPLPSAPMPMQPMHEKTLHLTASDYAVFTAADMEAVHSNLMRAAAGGDLAALTPAIRERNPQ